MSSQVLSVATPSAPMLHPYGVDEPQRLRAARHSRDLTQTTLAERAGVDQTAISKAEKGRLRLEDATLARVARRVLDAAACARQQGAPVTLAEILLRALV